jgi:hypothetical protein
MKPLLLRLSVPAGLATATLLAGAFSAHAAASTNVVQLDFGSRPWTSTGTASVDVSTVTRDSGSLSLVDSLAGEGTAVSTPAFDPDADAPRAAVSVVATSGDDPLSPGTSRFSFGADVRLDPHATYSEADDSTDNGDNIVQRGVFGSGNQYKLQVDGRRPSCRVAGSEGTVMVKADQPLVRGDWYRLSCLREGDEVTLYVMRFDDQGAVDDTQTYTAQGATGSVRAASSDVPLSVGGSMHDDATLKRSCDQFNGDIDAVGLAIG